MFLRDLQRTDTRQSVSKQNFRIWNKKTNVVRKIFTNITVL